MSACEHSKPSTIYHPLNTLISMPSAHPPTEPLPKCSLHTRQHDTNHLATCLRRHRPPPQPSTRSTHATPPLRPNLGPLPSPPPATASAVARNLAATPRSQYQSTRVEQDATRPRNQRCRKSLARCSTGLPRCISGSLLEAPALQPQWAARLVKKPDCRLIRISATPQGPTF